MKTKQIIFGILACITLLAVSCETSNIADENNFYEQSPDKSDLIKTI